MSSAIPVSTSRISSCWHWLSRPSTVAELVLPRTSAHCASMAWDVRLYRARFALPLPSTLWRVYWRTPRLLTRRLKPPLKLGAVPAGELSWDMSTRLSAGVVVVRNANGSWLFLMLRAYRNWDFPKGALEPGEGPLQAAVREVKEETLIEDLQFNWGEVYRETAP